MTHLALPFYIASALTLLLSLLLLPWWIISPMLLTVLLGITWQNRGFIDFNSVKIFIKEFFSFSLTVAACVLWIWQLSLWLDQLSF